MARGVCAFWAMRGLLVLGLWGPTQTARAVDANSINIKVETESAEQLVQPGKEIPVTITVTDNNKNGLAKLPILLDVSAGKILKAVDAGSGIYRTTFTMPSERHPQAIILAAKIPGALPGWTVLRLRSKTVLPVNTDKPSVMVTLNISGRTYGPLRTDAQGDVKMSVEVYPGDREALAEAVDDFGNRTSRRVAIPVPPSASLAGFAERTDVAADGRGGTDLYILSIEQDGSPSTRAAFSATTNAGSLSGFQKVKPGLFKLRFTAPSGLSLPKAKINVASKTQAALSRREFSIRFITGQPESIKLMAAPASLVADGKSQAVWTLTIADRGGNPLDNLEPALSCSVGFPGPFNNTGAGKYQANFTAPSRVGPLVCTARLERGEMGPLETTASVALTSPVPGSIKAVLESKQLLTDGTSGTHILIELLDKAGNPLSGNEIRVKAPVGVLGKVVEDGQGRYRVRYTAPKGTEDTKQKIQVEAGDGDNLVQQEVLMELEGVKPPPPPAPLFVLGPSVGVAHNLGRLVSVTCSLEAEVRLPFAKDSLYLALESGYRFGQKSGSTTQSGVSINTRVEVSPLQLAIIFKPMPHSRVTPRIGLGGGLDFVQWSLDSGNGGTEKNHQALWGAQASVGGEFRLPPGALVLQLRYRYAYLSAHGKPSAGTTGSDNLTGSTVRGNVGGLELDFGYVLYF